MRQTRAGAAGDPVDLGVLNELVGYRLRRAQLAVFADLVQSLARVRLRPGPFGVLAVIGGNPGLSQAATGDALGIQRANLVAIVSDLESRGLVERSPCARDRRQNALHLTPEGRRLLARARAIVHGHEQRVAARLRPAERRQLRDLLARVEAGACADPGATPGTNDTPTIRIAARRRP